MSERTTSGYQISFAHYCPFLKENDPKNSSGLFFTPDTAIASETHCLYGGLPGVEQKSESGMLVPINPDKIVVSCPGCTRLPGGFEDNLEDVV